MGDRRLWLLELRPSARPHEVGNKHADHDRHRRIQQQQHSQPPRVFSGDLRRHQHVHYSHENQWRSERTQQLQNHLARHLEDERPLAQQDARKHTEHQGDQNSKIERNRIPTGDHTSRRQFLSGRLRTWARQILQLRKHVRYVFSNPSRAVGRALA